MLSAQRSAYFARREAAWDRIRARNAQAIGEGTLVGRFFRDPQADGFAVYQVTAVDGEWAEVERAEDASDYLSPLIEMQGKVPVDYAKARAMVDRRHRGEDTRYASA